MKINRSLLVSGILLTVILVLPCSGATGSCNGVNYNKDIYRCEYGELIGKCKGKDYYVAYDQCINGVVVSGTASSNNSGTTTGNRGTFTDVRDGKTYKWVQIGTQTWMAENLKYNASGSRCCDNDPANCNNNPANCQKYGRFYDWNMATKSCPRGWHLPSRAEWSVLITVVGGVETASKYLKAVSGWNKNGNGTDAYGFSALPGGKNINDFNLHVGEKGYWWSSSENDADTAYSLDMDCDYDFPFQMNHKKLQLFSVRCVQD